MKSTCGLPVASMHVDYMWYVYMKLTCVICTYGLHVACVHVVYMCHLYVWLTYHICTYDYESCLMLAILYTVFYIVAIRLHYCN